MKQLFFKTVILLFISVLLTNCNKDEDLNSEELFEENNPTISSKNAETVSFDEAITYFNTKNTTRLSAKTTSDSNSITLNPDWNSFNQTDLFNTDALLTSVQTKVNRKGNYTSKLFFIKVNGEMKNVIYTIYEDSLDTNGNIVNARFFLNELDGTYIDGYKIENGNTLKRYVIKNSLTSKKNLTGKTDPPSDCWNTDTLDSFGGGSLPTVYITGSSGGSSGGFSGIVNVSRGPYTGSHGSYYSQANGYGGGGSGSNQTITLSRREIIEELAGGIVVNPPANEDYIVYIDFTNTTKIDPFEELKCFDKNIGAKLTIYVKQPSENTYKLNAENSVGHVSVGLEQNGIKKYFGFYPPASASNVGIGIGKTYDSELRDNSNDLFHVNISRNISASQMEAIINYVQNYPKKYDLNSYACTDFGIKIGNLGGIPLKSTTVHEVYIPYIAEFHGRSPAYLGQEIREMTETSELKINKTKGNIPSKSKEKC